MQQRLMAWISASIMFLPVGAPAADAPPLTAGLWEVATTPDLKGIPANPMPKIDQLCLSDQAIRDGIIPLRIAVACKVTGGTWRGDKLNLAISCQDAPADTAIPNEISANGQGFSGYIALNAMITYRYQGKWLGAACH